MKLVRNRRKGQAIVEYIIIIVIVAVAALTVMGIFSDRIRTIIAGAASSLGANNAAEAVEGNSSLNTMRELDASGIEISN
jgi:Flp pilus assembly pilin Flp